MAGSQQVLEGALTFPDSTGASGAVFYFLLLFLSTHSEGFLRSNYNRISMWWV